MNNTTVVVISPTRTRAGARAACTLWPARDGDAEVLEGVEQRQFAEVEGVVVGEGDVAHAEQVQRASTANGGARKWNADWSRVPRARRRSTRG